MTLKNRTIEDGMVMGHVSTNLVNSTCYFAICTVEEWEELTEDEADKMAQDALWESGQVEWGY